ncbi:MAG: hypothetical protein ACK4FA_01315 [Candidatus Paceibacteria bacterium]
MTDDKAKKLTEIYTKAIARLAQILQMEKHIIAKHKKNIEDQKIEELRNKIQNNG